MLETAPLIYVVPQEVAQGHAFLVAIDAPGAGFASVAYGGEIFTLLREGDRLFAILPVEALTSPGPVPLVISVADPDGRQAFRRETIITVTDSAWGTEVVQLDENNQALLDPAVIGEDVEIRQAVQRALTPERHWGGLFDAPAVGTITSNFGLLRSYNFQQPTEYHSGLDFAGDNGDPVLAPNAGVVAWVGRTQRRGNSLIVDHGGGVYSGYYHLSEVLVTEGTVVTTGDPLGRVGATGLATGPHLHWEIVVHGITVNPVQWNPRPGDPRPGRGVRPVARPRHRRPGGRSRRLAARRHRRPDRADRAPVALAQGVVRLEARPAQRSGYRGLLLADDAARDADPAGAGRAGHRIGQPNDRTGGDIRDDEIVAASGRTVALLHGHPALVQAVASCVATRRVHGERVNVHRVHVGGAEARGGAGEHAGAGAEIEHLAARRQPALQRD